MGLRPRTTLAALAALVLLLAAVAYALQTVQRNSRETVVKQFESRAGLSASLVSSIVDRSAQVRIERADREIGASDPSLTRLRAYLGDIDTRSTAGLLLDARNHVLAATPGTGRALLSPAARPHPATSRTYTSGVVDVGRTPSIARSVVYLTPYGRRTVIDAEPLSSLDRFFKPYLSGATGIADGEAYLIDAADRLVASGGSLRSGDRIPDPYLVRALAGHPVGSFVDADGDRLVSARVPRSGLRIVLVAPQRALFATATGDTQRRLAWLLYAAFAVAFAAGLGMLLWAADRGRRLAVAERETQAQIELARERDETERLKGEFFALVSHELRTPLTSILGYVEMLSEQETERLSDGGRRHLEVVSRNADRLDRLVEDLLMVAQIEAGTFGVEPGEVDMEELARHSRQEQGPIAQAAGVELSIRSEEVPRFGGDPRRIGQVLDNLVANAIKFTPQGGRVEVGIAVQGDRCAIEVSDNGAGIEAAEVEHLFDRFYRSSSAGRDQIQGAGLGLAIAKAIVDAHDGEISVESSPGRGSTFHVRLPIRPIEQDARSEGRRRVEADATS
jgi:signal transduction histidine kinase